MLPASFRTGVTTAYVSDPALTRRWACAARRPGRHSIARGRYDESQTSSIRIERSA